MLSSEYLYGGLDKETATLQLALFTKKRKKALDVIRNMDKFDVGVFTEEQRELEMQLKKVEKSIVFCTEQIKEAEEVLNGSI
jgi:hypothetical protein